MFFKKNSKRGFTNQKMCDRLKQKQIGGFMSIIVIAEAVLSGGKVREGFAKEVSSTKSYNPLNGRENGRGM